MKKSFSVISITLIFAFLLLFAVIGSIFELTADSLMLATGQLKTENYTAADFSLKDLQPLENGNYITTSVDPQLIIYDYNNPCTMIKLKFTADRYPGEVNLYYTRGDEEFSNSQKVWGKARNDGTYEFIMPRGKLSKIRLDPANFSSLEINFESIILNPSRGFLSYFKYSGEEIFMFFAAGLLLSCLAKCIYEAFYEKLHGFGVKFVFKKKAEKDE